MERCRWPQYIFTDDWMSTAQCTDFFPLLLFFLLWLFSSHFLYQQRKRRKKSKTILPLSGREFAVRCPNSQPNNRGMLYSAHKLRADVWSFCVDNMSFGRITICHLYLLHISADAVAVVCLLKICALYFPGTLNQHNISIEYATIGMLVAIAATGTKSSGMMKVSLQAKRKAANKSTNTIFVRLCWTISAESITKNAVVSYYRNGLGRASDAELSKTEQWRVEQFSQHWFVTFPLGIFFISVSERYTIKWNINVRWLRNKTQNNNVQIQAQAHAHTSSPMISPINNNWDFPSLYYLDAM